MQTDLNNKLSVHIFRYEDIEPSVLTDYTVSLSIAERERAAQFNATRREQYIYERGCLRALLAERIQCKAAQINIEIADTGKPYVASIDGTDQKVTTDWKFNLSHSDQVFAIALSKLGDIGVDLDTSDRSNRLEAIAEYSFSEKENALLAKAKDESEHSYKQKFIQLWTAKEAIGKLLGKGINKTFLQNSLLIEQNLITANSTWLKQEVCFGNFELAPYSLSIAVYGSVFPEISIYDSLAKGSKEKKGETWQQLI